MKVKSLSRVLLFVTRWTVAHQAPPSVGFSRQEYWSGLPFPSPRFLLYVNTQHRKPLQAARGMETSRLRKFWIHGEAMAVAAVVRLPPFFGLKCFLKHSGLLIACVMHGDRGGEQGQRHFPASPSLVLRTI